MKYDHGNPHHRHILATTLIAMLIDKGFEEEAPQDRGSYTTKERVFSRPINERMRVAVYTTIEGTEVRQVGKDAIRVVALYRNANGQDRGVAKADKRVHRTGKISAVTDRTLNRMREVWRIASHSERCRHCGAPMFTSKKGNLVCADLCWTRRAA